MPISNCIRHFFDASIIGLPWSDKTSSFQVYQKPLIAQLQTKMKGNNKYTMKAKGLFAK